MKLLVQKVGGVTKNCSARCYNAKPNSNCACICKGKLHAIGEREALALVKEFYVRRTTDEAVTVTRQAMRALRREVIQEWGDTW